MSATAIPIHISPEKMRYNLKGTVSFRDVDGNQYEVDRRGAFELAALVLEALNMDVSERDELLFRLEDGLASC